MKNTIKELEEQVKGQFDFNFQEDYGAVREALLSAVEALSELQKRYDKEEADRVHYQEEVRAS